MIFNSFLGNDKQNGEIISSHIETFEPHEIYIVKSPLIENMSFEG